MAKHNLKQTKGKFKVVGKVTSTRGDRYYNTYPYSEKEGEKRALNFGVQTSESNVVYVSLDGYTNNEARFQKYNFQTKEAFSQILPWDERDSEEAVLLMEDGYRPMFGTTVGIALNEKGKKEPPLSMFGYDACEYLFENLEEGMSVYVEGNIEYSHYAKDGATKRYTNLMVTKIYIQEREIDFDDEKFKEVNNFEQEFVMNSIEPEKGEDNKATGRFIVSANIVTYNGVEFATFILEDKKLAGNLKKGVKPYWSIPSFGRLVTQVVEPETSDDEDVWGEDENFDSGNEIRYREMLITLATPARIDKESYSEEAINAILTAEDEFGDSLDNTIIENNDSDDDSDSDDDIWG